MSQSSQPHRVNVYIDSFNLYYAIKDYYNAKNISYRWLDLGALCSNLLHKYDINKIRYFTALVDSRPGNPNQQQRQLIYLRALRAAVPNLTIHYGKFLSSEVVARVVSPPPQYIRVHKTEEKGSDVNIATYLLLDAFDGDCDVAAVISNDTDLCEPIKVVRQRFNLPVIVFRPRDYISFPLQKVATSYRPIREGVLKASQLPDKLTDANGTIHKPTGW